MSRRWTSKAVNGTALTFLYWVKICSKIAITLELVSKELNHLAAILHVYAGGLKFMK
jgi:hypothetical protein